MRTYRDFMIDEANAAHNVDLRNLPAHAPLFAKLTAAELGAVKCAYQPCAHELAVLAAAYYLQTADSSDRWYAFAIDTCEGVDADEIIEDWATAEQSRYSSCLYSHVLNVGFLSEDARNWYVMAEAIDFDDEQPANVPVHFPDEVSLMLHDYYAAAQNRQ